MTKRSPEEINLKRLRNQAEAFRQLERPTMGVSVSLVFSLLDEIESLRAERQRTMPSREDFESFWKDEFEYSFPASDEVYNWLAERMK